MDAADYGVIPDSRDVRDGLNEMFLKEDRCYIPPGNYRLASPEVVRLKKSLQVECSPHARFYTTPEDQFNGGSFFQFEFNSNFYDPQVQVEVTITGGMFDLRNVQVGNTCPYLDRYPARNPSGSDKGGGAIGIKGDIHISGVGYSAIRRIVIDGCVALHCSDGEDWRAAGGEASFHARGYEQFIGRRCNPIGSRDSAFYLTAAETPSGLIGRDTTVENCRFDWCVRGPAVKRDMIGIKIINNEFVGTLGPIICARLVGDGSEGALISGNRFENYDTAILLNSTKAAVISGNTAHSCGYRFADDSKPMESFGKPRFLSVEGGQDNTVFDNIQRGSNSGYETSSRFTELISANGLGSTGNHVHDNLIRGVNRCGGEVDAEQNGNYFIDNNADASVGNRQFVVKGAASRVRNLES